jgi:hypothetical protein
MKFEDVLSALRAGKKVWRLSWNKSNYIQLLDKSFLSFNLSKHENKYHVISYQEWLDEIYDEDLLSEDWEIIEEPSSSGSES